MNFLEKAIKFGGGVILAQLITAASVPLLSRLYSPEEFSLFGLYFSLSAILVAFVTLKLETLLPKEHDIEKVLPVINTVAIIMFLPLTVITFFTLSLIGGKGSVGNIIWSILIVLAATTFNMFNTINILNVRENKLKLVNIVRMGRSLFSVVFQLLLYWMKGGLFLGEVLGRILGLIFLSKKKYYIVSFVEAKKMIITRLNYIKYVVSASFLNTLGLNLYPIVVLKFYDPILVGKFFFVQKLLSAPVTIFAQSISIALLGDFNKIIKTDKNELIKKIHKISLVFFLGGAILFLILGLILKKYESIIFGENWSGIFIFVFVLLPFLVGQTAFSPFSQLLVLTGGERKQLKWDIIRLILILLSIFLPILWEFNNKFVVSLALYSIFNFFMYLYHYYMVISLIRRFEV